MLQVTLSPMRAWEITLGEGIILRGLRSQGKYLFTMAIRSDEDPKRPAKLPTHKIVGPILHFFELLISPVRTLRRNNQKN